MGCGSSISQVAQMGREGGFRPLKLLEMSSEGDLHPAHGKVLLLGENRTQRKILEVDFKSSHVKLISSRTRIPIPRIHLDPIEVLYEQSQEVFHLGQGSCLQPPFNRMLALFVQSNLVFLCGGCDYDLFNIKSEAFYYTMFDEPPRISSEMVHSSEFSERTLFKPKYSRNKFQKMASMHRPRYDHTGLYSPQTKSVLVFGGYGQDNKPLASCEMYNVWENAWKELPPMLLPRASAQCFLYGSKVYLFGGRAGKDKLPKKIETFDTESNQWDLLECGLHRGIEKALVFSPSPNQILILGGQGLAQNYNAVLRVDLRHQTYIWEADLLHDHRAPKGAQLNHELFLFGGKRDACEVYFQGRWKEGILEHRKLLDLDDMAAFTASKETLVVKSEDSPSPALPAPDEQVFFGNDSMPCLLLVSKSTARRQAVPLLLKLKSGMGVLEYDQGLFFLCGGCDQNAQRSFRTCYYYDKSKNVAAEASKMETKRSNFACIRHDHYIYVFGGEQCQQKQPTAASERFDLLARQWQPIRPMPKPRSHLQAELVGPHCIALVPTQWPSPQEAHIDIYDTRTDSYQSYAPLQQLTGRVIMTNSRNKDEEFYVLREGTEGELAEAKVELVREKAEAPVVNDQTRISSHTLHVNESLKHSLRTKQEEQPERVEDSDFESELPKVREEGVVILSPQVINVNQRQHYGEQDPSGNTVSDREIDQCQIDRVSFDSEMMEEIRKSAKVLIQQRTKEIQSSPQKVQIPPTEIQKQKQPDLQHNPQEEELNHSLQQEELSHIPQDEELNHSPQKEEQHPAARPQPEVEPLKVEQSGPMGEEKEGREGFRLAYRVNDKIWESKLISWLREREVRVVRRLEGSFFLSQDSIFVYDFVSLRQQERQILLPHKGKGLIFF